VQSGQKRKKKKDVSMVPLVTDSDQDIFNADGTYISGSAARMMSVAYGSNDAPEDPDILIVYQSRWLQAQLSNRVSIEEGTREELHRVIDDRWSDRTLKQLIQKTFNNYDPKTRMPRPKTDRINALFDIAMEFRI
jgi:hypothetical protein